jgi:hypothetical protein
MPTDLFAVRQEEKSNTDAVYTLISREERIVNCHSCIMISHARVAWHCAARWYKNCSPFWGGIFLDGRRNAYQYNGRSVMRTDIGVSDYLSMLAIVAVLVSLWMH